jgi:hypothetical protein
MAGIERTKLSVLCRHWHILVLGLILLLSGCTREKVVFVQQVFGEFPEPLSLIHPSPDSLITSDHPSFFWHKTADGIRHQIQVSRTNDFMSKAIDAYTDDTSYTTISALSNDTYYWRARSRNLEGVWGNWADAELRIFYKSDYINFVELVSQTETYGVPQDIFVRGDTAYVADGQADLTMFDISIPAYPALIRNIDTRQDDFAKGVFVSNSDSFPFVYVADMDGKVQAFCVNDTSGLLDASLGGDQNIEDITGVILPDSTGVLDLWLISVSSGYNRRKLTAYQLPSGTGGNSYGFMNWIAMPADAMGLCYDSGYIYVADGCAGLLVIDFQDPHYFAEISSCILPGTALSIELKNDLLYLTCDRAGVFIVDISDRYNPTVVKNINTSGRAKDIQIVGDYGFIADGSGGLKVIDIAVADSAHVVTSYATPYAYGLWAGPEYIYLCDRDLGLMVFKNKVSP